MPDIRLMTSRDSEAVLEMMREFYTSPAVWSNGSEEIFLRDISACVEGSPYLEGYVFVDGDVLCGYAMLAKSFSTEFGKKCVWVEDIYIKESCRSKGIGTEFFAYVDEKYGDCVIRLEVEEDNKRAIDVYKKCGYEFIPYLEMKKENR
jgi:ribosomal protein S18 acetylase RimI-like enzyme